MTPETVRAAESFMQSTGPLWVWAVICLLCGLCCLVLLRAWVANARSEEDDDAE